VLRNVNRHLMKMSQHGLFVTVLYGILDNQSGEFTYARAGHELPLLCSAEQDAHLLPKSTGQPLGIFEEPELDQGAIHLTPTARLLLYTDGVTDEYDSQGNAYGLRGLIADIQCRAAPSAQATCDYILEQALEHLAGTSQDDDITLVAIHADPLP
jgi:sigma-B regulation protein RsbU (phosphoserine phosphatase)